MKEGYLGRLLSQVEAASLVRGVMKAAGSRLTVWDAHGCRLLGLPDSPADMVQQEHAILCAGNVVGSVSGGEHAELMAALLSHLVTQEADKEGLLDEVLGLYRQVNLLFGLSEKLAASLEPEAVGTTILREASRLIHATDGAVVLLDGAQIRRSLATVGQGMLPGFLPGAGCGTADAVPVGTKAEIISDVRLDLRYGTSAESARSLICAPLNSKNVTIGAVILSSQVPVTYTAADLSLLNSLASQAAPFVENALLYETTLQEAREREEWLRQQVEELRIELDQVRQRDKVAEITGSEYYKRLRDRADTLREIIHGSSAP